MFVKTQPLLGSQLSSVQRLPSLQASWLAKPQAALLQKSPSVQALLSLQGRALPVLLQPTLGSQASVVQGLVSSQVVIAPGKQAPAWQRSPWVQALLSVQVSASSGVAVQPVAGRQVSVVQGFPSSQVGAVPGTQAPARQASPTVQALPSSHAAVVGAKTQPVIASQLSAVQGLVSSQTVAAPGRQAPSLQASPLVQMLPSSQLAVLLLCTQPFVLSQESVVQGFLSSQSLITPPLQFASLQASPVVQVSPSSQVAVLLAWLQLPAAQLSVVQGFLSSQSTVLALLQTPARQASAKVQALPSSQGVPSPARVSPQTPAVQDATLQTSVDTGQSSATVHVVPSALPSALVASAGRLSGIKPSGKVSARPSSTLPSMVLSRSVAGVTPVAGVLLPQLRPVRALKAKTTQRPK